MFLRLANAMFLQEALYQPSTSCSFNFCDFNFVNLIVRLVRYKYINRALLLITVNTPTRSFVNKRGVTQYRPRAGLGYVMRRYFLAQTMYIDLHQYILMHITHLEVQEKSLCMFK